MEIEMRREGSTARLILNGRFDFNAYHAFNEHANEVTVDGAISHLAVDFENVKYIDSSALGMLLLLKERATSAAKSISLVKCNGQVYQALELGNFNRLFEISK